MDILVALNEELHAERVVQLIEAPGFLEAPDDPGSLVPRMSRTEVERREAAVSGRMKRKMLALGRLVRAGSTRVVIADGRVAHPVRDALAGRGTVIE